MPGSSLLWITLAILNSLWVPFRSAFGWWHKIGGSAVLGGHPALACLLLNLDKVLSACCLSFLFSVPLSQIPVLIFWKNIAAKETLSLNMPTSFTNSKNSNREATASLVCGRCRVQCAFSSHQDGPTQAVHSSCEVQCAFSSHQDGLTQAMHSSCEARGYPRNSGSGHMYRFHQLQELGGNRCEYWEEDRER